MAMMISPTATPTNSNTCTTTTKRSTRSEWLLVLAVSVCFVLLDVSYLAIRNSSPSIPSAASVTTGIVKSGRRQLGETKKIEETQYVEFDAKDRISKLRMFALSDYTVLGPTQFPTPTRCIQRSLASGTGNSGGPTVVEVAPIIKPVLGQHRSDHDAVFAFAAEYDLSIYQGFILSLRKTGFQGDIVLAVSPLDLANPDTNDKPTDRQIQLHSFFASDPHVIIYVVPFVCYNAEGQSTESAKGGIRICHCHVLYGTRNVTQPNKDRHIEYSATEWKPIPDFREARPVATTRYELYWIWSTQYQPHTWQMLVDARDTFFQEDPFASVPREPNLQRKNGVIFFFGENAEATRIGKSDKNRKWLTNAYGLKVIRAMEDKPTICSGATMGEQIALETYLRAMVNEFDETEIRLMGADQGFHNYLYYSGKLQYAERIRSITVFDQGRGIVNNMGAMRTKEPNEWGNGKLIQTEAKSGDQVVFNWDETISPVVHQFDRFKPLGRFFYRVKTKELAKDWEQRQADKKKKKKV
ncbi:expressed unknown protein [Seminavis robusta]|uniref:Uncharacterized protein n=1 Tax=Seminavis robusta TaxID=568900 RepID=A0A9N8HD25_9STRA|nr:expressed unknown protein [Seminavis robusta]|eukprot:Sro406_g136440.1 n/a (525) ;mRNA; r:45459-47152